MTPLEVVDSALSRPLFAKPGVPVKPVPLPGLSPEEIVDFEKGLPSPLPEDVRELLGRYGGLEGFSAEVDFTGRTMDFEQEDVFPTGLPIAADGFGNFWVVDLHRASNSWGPIYFACHDAPVILYQSADLTGFLLELFKAHEPPFKSLIDDVHEDRLFNVWGTNPDVLTPDQARESGDPDLAAFADNLDESWSIVDLRRASPGQGFSWGRYGPQTEVRRYGIEPVFAYKKPLKKRFLGLFG